MNVGQIKEDRELVAAAMSGDEDACTRMYKKYRRPVANAVQKYCRPEDVEDLMQVAFLRIFTKLGSYKGDSALKTWIHRVAVNEALQHFRRKSERISHTSTSIDAAGKDNGMNEMQVWEPSSENLAIPAAQDRHILLEAIHSLAPSQRDAFLLRLEGFSLQEIADAKGVTMGAVKGYISHGKHKLAAYIELKTAVKREAYEALEVE